MQSKKKDVSFLPSRSKSLLCYYRIILGQAGCNELEQIGADDVNLLAFADVNVNENLSQVLSNI